MPLGSHIIGSIKIIFRSFCLFYLVFFVILLSLFSNAYGLDYSADKDNLKDGEAIDELMELSFDDLLDVEMSVASKFSEDELNLGSTVSKITRKDWQRRGARRLRDAIATETSIVVTPVLWDGTGMAIRGFLGSSSVSGISMQIDDVPVVLLRTGSGLFDTLSYQLGVLDSIEIIKGPGSALHGSDAFHGVIATKTFESDTDLLSVGAELGTLNYQQGDIRLSHGISDINRVNAAFSVSHQGEQNQTYHNINATNTGLITGERDLNYDSYMGVIKLNSVFSNDFSSYVNFYLKGRDSEEGSGLGPSRNTIDIDHSDSDEQFQMINAGLAWTFSNNITLEAGAYAWNTDTTRTFSRYNNSNNPIEVQIFFEESREGIKLHIKQPDNDWNTQWVVGLESSHASIDDNHNRLVSLLDGSQLNQSVNVSKGYERNVNSLIAQAKTHFFDRKLDVLYGARIDNYVNAFGSHKSPRLGLIYHLQSDSVIKLLYGQAFTPASSLDIFGGITIKGDLKIAPEIIDTYEFVYLKHAKNWKLNVTLFKSDWSDGIHNVATNDPDFNLEVANIGELSSKGLEITYRYVYSSWFANANASYVKSSNKTDNFDYDSFPRYLINLGLGYRLEQYNLEFYLQNQWHISRDEGPVVLGVIDDPRELSDYFRTDISVQWQASERWKFSAYIRNLFDRNNATPSTFTMPNGHPDESINASLNMSYSF